MADASKIMKHLFLSLLPHRAGVEQNHIGFSRIVRFFHAPGVVKHIGHLVRVILVHLAAKRFNVKFFYHASIQVYAKRCVELSPEITGIPLSLPFDTACRSTMPLPGVLYTGGEARAYPLFRSPAATPLIVSCIARFTASVASPDR